MIKFFVILILVVVTRCDLYVKDFNYPTSSQNIKIHHHPSQINYGRDQDSFREGDGIKFDKLSNLDTKVQTVEVCAKVGCIRGKVESGRKKPYDAFYGIPYAEPPVGKLRLENPVPHKGWSGHWDATYARSDCIQRNYYISTQHIVGSEDCLYLNVYRPTELGRNLPVLVYIHGGGFVSFAGNPRQFGPEYFMDNGEVIVVTMNYRLGPFGFLCSGDGAVKGNFGLKDQQMVLKWVSENIEAFGGDLKSITLAGQSVGAASVQYHMMNPVSSTFFNRSIVMSGSATAFWFYANYSIVMFRQTAQYSGLENWETLSTSELANKLKTLDPLNLIVAHDRLFIFPSIPSIPLRPCIEGDWEGAFLKENPRTTWSEGNFPQKPILFSTVTNEGAFIAPIPTNDTRLEQLSENMDKLLPIQYEFSPNYLDTVLNFYLNGNNYLNEKNVQSYYQMHGDRVFYHPTLKSAIQYLKYADTQKNPVFIYKFGFKSDYTFVKPMTGKDINLGVCHLDDIIYLFSMKEFFPVIEPNTPEGKMSDILVRTIVNFIVRGEIRKWTNFESCTQQASKSFCDYQVFTRQKRIDTDTVLVSVSNEIDQKMIDLWDKVGYVN